MKAGRELDGLVAKAMCLKDETIPHYSTEMSAAWTIFEKFASTSPHHSPAISSAFLGFGEGDRKGWCVSLGDVYSIYAETAPLAICLAALKACDCVGDEC